MTMAPILPTLELPAKRDSEYPPDRVRQAAA
jgi:hypothetical protein